MEVRFSDQREALFKALSGAQKTMAPALKDARNPHFRSKYATVSAVLQAVLDAFTDHGLSVTQHPGFTDGLVTLETVVGHSSGQWMSSTVAAPLGGRKDVQAVGSAITYLRRYSLQSIAGLPTEDDDGNAASSPPRTPARKSIVPQRPKRLGPKELAYWLTRKNLTLADLEDWCAAHEQPDPSALNATRQSQLLGWLDNRGAEKIHAWLEARRNAGPDEGDGEDAQ
tara:strand:- start:791 stop:1468 length:678 start_codon:yes stop_codon:yes gene_type:complete